MKEKLVAQTEELRYPPSCFFTTKKQKKEDPLMLTYKDIFLRDPNPDWLRKRIYQFTLKHSISQTAKEFGCHINTVKKIKKRGKQNEFSNRSKAPRSSPNQLSQDVIDLIYIHRTDKQMGHHNLKHQYNIPCAPSTIYKYLKRKDGVIKERKKKWKQSKDLRTIKQKYKAFEHLQMDGKVLYDIPQFYGYYKKFNIPRLQYTITCQKTGASFIAFADGETMTEACTFVVYFFEHLKKFGIDVKSIKLKTDQGSYALGSVRSLKKSNFTRLIQDIYQAKHRVNQHKNQNADVERFHGLIEEYFYKQTHITSKSNFFIKAAESIVWFNFIRKNGSKNWATPLQILKQDYPNIDPNILALPPIYLNKCTDLYSLKIDPNYKPMSKRSFFIDLSDEQFAQLNSKSTKHDLLYFSGDASKSCYLKKEVSNV